MASIGPLCSVCECLNTTTKAFAWCSTCNETLCEECLELHGISESTCNHGTIAIDEYLELPAFVQNIELYCTKHHQKYEAFCCNHEHALCNQCIENNKDCGDIRPLSEIVGNAKSSVAFELLEDCLNDAILNIQKIIKDSESNLCTIDEQRVGLRLEIGKIRENVIQRLAKIEELLLKELSLAADDAIQRKENILKELYVKEKILVEMQESMIDIKENASNFQTYFATKDMEDFVSKADQHLDEVLSLGNASLQFDIDKNIENLLNDVSEFGKITCVTIPSSAKIVRSKDKQAQMKRSTFEVSLTPSRTIEVGRGLAKRSRGTTGCCFHTNSRSRYIFAEYVNTQLVVHNKDGKCIRFSSLHDIPVFDVAFASEKFVAMTAGPERQIKMYNVLDDKMVKEEIGTSGNCYGITNHNGNLLCCIEGRGVELIDVKSKFSSLVIPNNIYEIPMGSYIASKGDRICISNKKTDSVVVFSSDFTKLWEYQFSHTLQSPRGVAIDGNNRVYVVGNFTNNVVMLSANGRQIKEVLNESNGLDRPCGICYDSDTNLLMVTNMSGTAFLFECN